MVTVTEPPPGRDIREPDDRPFLELALYAGADALITGDADLLALAPVFAAPIITAAELRSRLAGAA